MSVLKLDSGIVRQSTFDAVGVGEDYSEVHFMKGTHTIVSPIELNSGTKISSESEAWVYLQKNVSIKAFPSQTPLFGQTGTTIKNIEVDGLNIYGNGENQLSETGDGFHNCFGFKNCENIKIKNMHIKDTLGDGARITGGKGITYYNNHIYKCGHDGLYINGGSDIEAYNNYVGLRTNSGVRIRHANNAHVYNNTFENVSGGLGTGAGIQVEVSDESRTLSNILIEGNTFQKTYAPGIWAICRSNKNTNAAKNLTIRNNVFENCGLMTAKLSGTGGIVCDGITNVLIEKNKFKNCRGYAVLFGSWILVESAGSGYTATVRYNTIENQTAGVISGTATGTALANLIPKKYQVTAYGNTFKNNVRNVYNIVEIPDPGESENPETTVGVIIKGECDTNKLDELKKIVGDVYIEK